MAKKAVKRPAKTISINRAPVLTLWATVVAQRLGFNRDEGLSLAKAVAGLNAQAKGRSLGIFKPGFTKGKPLGDKKRGEAFWVELCGRPVPAVNTTEGVRAVKSDKQLDPADVQKYLDGKFGEDLKSVEAAMKRLAASRDKKRLAEEAFKLYERFRPQIPPGTRGWGAKGDLDLRLIESLAKLQ